MSQLTLERGLREQLLTLNSGAKWVVRRVESFSLPLSQGPLAQLAEQLTLNQPVLGSSPRGLTYNTN